MINICFISSLVLLSFLPTLASFMNFYEGNVQRLLMLIMLTFPLFIKINSRHDLTRVIKYVLKNSLCVYLICTTCISIFHILIERKPTSINYIDIVAPSCLLIYGTVLSNKISLKSIFIAIQWIIVIWICVGILELLFNLLYGNTFCLPHCIYYENRPNYPKNIQDLWYPKSYISLESLGLATQEFTVLLGAALLICIEHFRQNRKFYMLLLVFLIILIDFFSLSLNSLIAQIMAISIAFNFKTFQIDIKHILLGGLVALLSGYVMGFHFFSFTNLYLHNLILAPISFIFSLNWYEILFGLMNTESYPAENRIIVLMLRFGAIWFIYTSIQLICLYKFLAVSGNTNKFSIIRMLFIFFCLVSIHNNLWHTLSGTLIFSLFIILFYKVFRS